jgi:hypothetical protein
MGVFKTLEMKTQKIDENLAKRKDYETFKVNDLVDGDPFTGEIYLSEIYENEFTDDFTGETKKNYSANLYISNDENKETLKARVNFKSLNDNITVWQGSMPYDIIDSIEELNNPGSGGVHNIYNMSFKELQDHVNQLGNVTVKVKAHTGDFDYNTLRIVEVN